MRLRPLAVVALVATLLVPSSGHAGALLFYVSGYVGAGPSELGVHFGQVPFEVPEQGLHESDLSFLNGFFLAGGSAHLVSGPLLDLTVETDMDGVTHSRYTYGPGMLELVLAMAYTGPHVSGTFSAPTKSFSFVVCEGCDRLFGGGTAGDFAIELGPGTFSAHLAEFLHISPHTAGGYIDFGLEDIEGEPFDEVRIGNDHRGLAYLQIDGVEVPEPGTAVLILAGMAGVAMRRARGSRRRSPGPPAP